MRRPVSAVQSFRLAGLVAGIVFWTNATADPSLTVVAGGRTAIYTTAGCSRCLPRHRWRSTPTRSTA